MIAETKPSIIDILGEDIEGAVVLEGLGDAVLGVCERYGMDSVVAYDYDKIIDIYIRDGMSYDEAVEWFEFNVIGGWFGDRTPVFVRTTT